MPGPSVRLGVHPNLCQVDGARGTEQTREDLQNFKSQTSPGYVIMISTLPHAWYMCVHTREVLLRGGCQPAQVGNRPEWAGA